MRQQLWLFVVMLAVIAATPATAQAKQGCQERCGNLTIPYPFGTSEGCYLDDSFLITCNESYKPFLRKSNIKVLNISLDGQLQVSSDVAYGCYDESGNLTRSRDPWMNLAKFNVSYTRNKFTVVGCDTNAYVWGVRGKKFQTGCMSLCDEVDQVVNGSCSGIGCCQTSIPRGVTDFNLIVNTYYNYTYVSDFNPCGFAFVVEEGSYNFSSLDLFNLSNVREFPVVLDWTIGNKTCEEARKDSNSYACGMNSTCNDSNSGLGYLCNCNEGYQGNPYLGCQDINECQNTTLNLCTIPKLCHNTDGNYTCSCPKGYHGNGRKDGNGCIADEHLALWVKVFVGISIGLIAILVIIIFTSMGVQKRNISKVREDFFKQNGGIVLQQLLSKSEGSVHTAKIYSQEELNKATNNFNERHIVGEGGYGTVYRGTLADNTIIAIKKSKIVDRGQIEQFVTEVKILSQIDHPNVVKLLGCCLETPMPLLVYEFITNNTLYHHLHNKGVVSSMPWEMRLRIATETANAIALMHSSTQIIHRDIKSANILLNEDFTAKVSDFGISKFVPSGETHLTTAVQGTIGYIDPEYFHSGNLTEKSDVYSFGVLLVELLTGENPIPSKRAENSRSLAKYFITALEEDHLLQILDDRVKGEGNVEQLKGVSELAKQMLKIEGEKRPTMEEVKQELEAFRNFNNCSPAEIPTEERLPLLSGTLDYHDSTAWSGLDTVRKQTVFEMDSGGR
ncbi:hypothetical protein F0562_002792 [Nyssa sinensis]|uniref:Protein kinase domain-containing protein n=1 Tax=Nyssa sinensis TaxID=561372 RepID=A0A5J5BU22_9ASTE|nr:hypothetical protein F0562_002792 [Nyssa sinensis]